jgi:hypothetical protein
LLTQGRAASHPQPRFARQAVGQKIPSPRPPSFLPDCWRRKEILARRNYSKPCPCPTRPVRGQEVRTPFEVAKTGKMRYHKNC